MFADPLGFQVTFSMGIDLADRRAEARAKLVEKRMDKADERAKSAEERMDKFDQRLEATRKLVETGMKLMVRMNARIKVVPVVKTIFRPQ